MSDYKKFVFYSQIILAFAIVYGIIPAGPPTLAIVFATFLMIHALWFVSDRD
jgi:hypothetical protein